MSKANPSPPPFEPGKHEVCRRCIYAHMACCEHPQAKHNGGRGLWFKDMSCSGRQVPWDKKLFEQLPRFKGCPPVCLATNLPALPSREAAYEWHEDANPRGPIVRKPWLCGSCDCWHYLSTAADPAGGSSGTSRNQKHYATH